MPTPSEIKPSRAVTRFILKAGHCSRCGEPFAADAVLYMVRHRFKGLFGDVRRRGPVCADCMDEGGHEPHPNHTGKGCAHCRLINSLPDFPHTLEIHDLRCPGCGRTMRQPVKWRTGRFCSTQCEQRARRAQERSIRRRTCPDVTCRKPLPSSARADAVYCSNACRQRCYRRSSKR